MLVYQIVKIASNIKDLAWVRNENMPPLRARRHVISDHKAQLSVRAPHGPWSTYIVELEEARCVPSAVYAVARA